MVLCFEKHWVPVRQTLSLKAIFLLHLDKDLLWA
jgi:hypothetical protein